MKLLQTLVLFLFVINSFSQVKKSDSILLRTFFNEKGYSAKKTQVLKNILQNNSSTKTTEEWIQFFDNEEAKYNNNFPEIFYIIRCKSMVYIQVEDYKKSNEILFSFYYKYKNIANKNNLCRILYTLSNNCIKLNKKLELLIINKEQLEICPSSHNFYELYSKIGLVDLAVKNYREINPYKENEIGFTKGKNQNNIGVFYKIEKRYDSAFYYFNKSLFLLEKVKQKGTVENKAKLNFWIGLVKGNLGECYLEFENYDKAIELLSAEEKEAKIWFKGRVWPYEDDYFKNMTIGFLNTRKPGIAKKYIDSLFLKKNILYYSKLKSDYFDVTKRYDSAHYYNKLFIKTSDSISKQYKQELNTSILKLINFQEELIAQKFKISEIEKENKLKKKVLIFISLLLVLLIISILTLIRSVYDKNNQKEIIRQQNVAIKKTLSEKNILFSELHHRVKNNFQIIISILNLQLQKIGNDEFKNTFQYSINRVTTIARIHDKILKSSNINEIPLKDYLEDIINDLKLLYTSLHAINIKINVDSNICVFIDQTQVLGLITNELITNSYKYAFSNNTKDLITLNITEKQGVISFNYSDNGVGFDLNKIDQSNSIGITLVQRLANQLGTTANIASKNGMKITFSFKNNINN